VVGEKSEPKAEKLPAFMVSTNRYKALLTPDEQQRLKLYNRFGKFGWPGIGVGPYVFTPSRVPQGPKTVASSLLEADVSEPLEPSTDVRVVVEHLSVPSVTLDEALLPMLDFSLSGQRDNSITQSHQQAVVLRGVGSGGAGASVLQDGMPLNDPFSGWVEWPAVTREGLDRIEVVLCGGSTAWGNATLGGVVQLFTLPANGKLADVAGTPNDGGPPDPNLTKQVVCQVSQLTTYFGQYGTRNAEFVSAQPTNAGVLQVIARVFSTDGSRVVASENRGNIDCAEWSKERMFEARWHQPVGKSLELTATMREFSESHSDGTPGQETKSGGEIASVAISSAPSSPFGFAWNANAYLRHRSYNASITEVDATRSTEIPLITKSAVPATAFGANWTGQLWDPGQKQGRMVVGTDMNFVRGEVREEIDYLKGSFTRELVAGGNQGIIGFFASRDQPISSTVRAAAAIRLDLWKDTDGHRREVNQLSGVQISNELYGMNSGAQLSPSLGFIWRPHAEWLFRAHGQESYRRPTLGERYEIYSHNSFITEPNAELKTEQNTGLEIGTEYTPTKSVTLGVAAFSNELRDAIGRTRVERGSGEYPLYDSLPLGYLVQKRINLDRARVQGLKLFAKWNPIAALSFDASVLFNDPTILGSTSAPALKGKQSAEVSRTTAAVSAKWQASKKVAFRLNVRYFGPQFVDDENTLRLGEALVANLGTSYDITEHAELYLTVDNLTNAAVGTGLSDDGVSYIGPPRVIIVGVRLRW
jgi:outer membrane receptor protein involved in Fe transport